MDRETISSIKSLGIDMITHAKSGHPGIVLGAAPMLYTLYAYHLNINKKDKHWINRDRFVMSAGHGSALLYATIFMAGIDYTIEDLKSFRKLGSKAPGHPEYTKLNTIEVTTGPLGEGLATSVGIALGERILNQKTKINKNSLIDFNTYCLCGDGDLMEGIATEAASFAGAMKLSNLIVLYDSNNISLDGKTNITFNENIRDKFSSLGWSVYLVKNGNNIKEINKAIEKAKKSNKPSLIEIKTIIGDGSNLKNTNSVHGKPLEKDDIDQLKQKLDMPDEMFIYSENAKKYFSNKISDRIDKKYDKWIKLYDEYIKDESNKELVDFINGKSKSINLFDIDFGIENTESLRVLSGKVMNKICDDISFLSGSADLFSSTNVYLKDKGDISADNYNGKNIWFGVRENAMGAILNGLSLLNFKVSGSTFLSFADYLRPSIRLSALMHLPVNYIFTHDSVNIGQDGPTHQPIEQLASLRIIPNLTVFRPCDINEIIGSWNYILNNNINPTALVLSRNKTTIDGDSSATKTIKGAYIIRREKFKIDGILIATGSEVEVALNIANILYEEAQIDIRVVSMPSRCLFEKMDLGYQNEIIPKVYKRIVIEAGISFGWDKYATSEKHILSIDTFGHSGSPVDVLTELEFSEEILLKKVYNLLKR